jgi:hypothetical protein
MTRVTTKKLENVKNVPDLAEPVSVLVKTVVLIVTTKMNINTITDVINHVQKEPIMTKFQKKLARIVIKDVLFVKMKHITNAHNVMMDSIFLKHLVSLAQHVKIKKDTIVMAKQMNANNVTLSAKPVKLHQTIV